MWRGTESSRARLRERRLPDLLQRYGFPFKGYRYLTASQMADRHYVVGDATLISQGFLLDPIEGKLMRRGGCSIAAGSTGVLETAIANSTPYGRQIIALDSQSLSDGYPTWLVVFLDEAKAFGWLYWRDGSTDLNFAEKDYAAAHYPPTNLVGAEYICIPVAYEANGTGLTRGINELNRRFFVSGSRRVLPMGRDLYSPGSTSSPSAWRGRRWNVSSSSGTEPCRFGPTGLIRPLHPGRFVTANQPAEQAASAPWKNGDQFFASVAFINESGEVSMPYMCSGAAGTNRTNEFVTEFGLVTIPGTAGMYRTHLLCENVPIGPGGTMGRLMLRSEKVDSTLAGAFPNRLVFKVCGIIRDNTTTTFKNELGSDLSLVDAPEMVRLDRKWVERSRYHFPFDQRVAACGNLRQNPYAIVVAPTGVTNPRDINNADTDVVAVGAHYFAARVILNALQLRYGTGTTLATSSFSLTSGATLQSVVDLINQTVVGGTGKEWCAQLVDGVSPDILASYLALTSFNVNVDSAGVRTINNPSGGDFTDVAVGMRIHHATKIAAGTYVVSVESSTSLTISADVLSSLSGDAVTFAVDTGDDYLDAAAGTPTYGNVFAKGGAWPVALPLKASYLALQPTLARDLIFTTGGPLDPPNAANSYVAGNRRPVPATAGIAMGGAPLLNGARIYFSRAMGRLYNVRGGKTGEDADYRAEIEVWGRGCLSPYSIVWGDGWAGCLTDAGFEVSDSTGSRVISLDPNPSRTIGEWAYEMGQCKNAAESNGNDYQFYAHVENGKLRVAYRRSASYATPSHIMVYDFSASAQNSGLAQLFRPTGEPWGWSAPIPYSWRSHSAAFGKVGAIGSVRKSDGVYVLTCDDTNDKTTCGLIARIEDGTWVDGSDRVTAQGYLALDLHDTFERKSAQMLRVMRYNPGANERAKFFRSGVQAGGATIVLIATSGAFKIEHASLPLASRSLCDQTQILLEAIGGSGSTDVHYHGAELELETHPAYRTTGG